MKIKGRPRSRWGQPVRNYVLHKEGTWEWKALFFWDMTLRHWGNWFPAFHGNNQNPRPHHRESLKTHTAREYNDEEPGENTDTSLGLVARLPT
jgi:hypothetical protein